MEIRTSPVLKNPKNPEGPAPWPTLISDPDFVFNSLKQKEIAMDRN